ncbi:MAG: hypothetical protein JEZ07_20325 [Phycisphaerae bacterium]|nr:hypothetical protein [Phycisphaerae bacterium]
MDHEPKHWVKETTLASNDRFVFSKKMVKSKAYAKLNLAAVHILIELYTRLKVSVVNSKNKGQKTTSYHATNNGQLVMTYKSIHKLFGHSEPTIGKAIDQLCELGFIEIAEPGCGAHRQSHKFALTTNWQDYGTDKFIPNKGRPGLGPANGGFKTNGHNKKEKVNCRN